MAILDIGLPGLDGYELARRFRAAGRQTDLTLIALTGWVSPPNRAAAFEAGFDHFFPKPPDLGALERVLRQTR